MIKHKNIKGVVNFIVGLGVSKIVNDIISNNVDTETVASKVTVGVAGIAIGNAVAEATSTHTDNLIDKIFDYFEKMRIPE